MPLDLRHQQEAVEERYMQDRAISAPRRVVFPLAAELLAVLSLPVRWS
ncbi:MAG: hypothetical protein IPN63_00015 [Gammaproteobacteria bacterium]|nr:hypothetical protein [Gammaproteobacteria bacterium]